jgi:hypothetical protein
MEQSSYSSLGSCSGSSSRDCHTTQAAEECGPAGAAMAAVSAMACSAAVPATPACLPASHINSALHVVALGRIATMLLLMLCYPMLIMLCYMLLTGVGQGAGVPARQGHHLPGARGWRDWGHDWLCSSSLPARRAFCAGGWSGRGLSACICLWATLTAVENNNTGLRAPAYQHGVRFVLGLTDRLSLSDCSTGSRPCSSTSSEAVARCLSWPAFHASSTDMVLRAKLLCRMLHACVKRRDLFQHPPCLKP